MKQTIDKFFTLAELLPRLAADRDAGRRIVFTNGCFDVVHVGHVRLLETAKSEGDVLVVAINSDASVKRLGKGDDRPIHNEAERAELLSAFSAVDYVLVFEEDTPLVAVTAVQPDVLVKGGDWGVGEIVGAEVVEARGGYVVRVNLVPGRSTTNLVNKVRSI